MLAFQPNCTLPPDGVSYVASSNTRSTLDILWTSLATIFACTYSVLHLNVPQQRRGRDPGWIGDMKWSFRSFRKKVKWCIITLFLPELVLAKALADILNARKQLRCLHRDHLLTVKTVSLTHMLFADMGGFVLGYRSKSEAKPSGHGDAGTPQHTPDPEQIPMVDHPGRYSHDSFANGADGEVRRPSSSRTQGNVDVDESGMHLWHLNAFTIRHLILDGHIPARLPYTEEITDRSKTDMWAKAITLLQICYFVLALLVRLSHRLPISELELGTAAFVVCSAFTYMVTFAKPKSPETTIMISAAASEKTMRAVRHYARISSKDGFWTDSADGDGSGCPPRNDLLHASDEHETAWYLSIFATTVFSAIHVGGWNLTFPSVAEMWVWRASAIATTAAPLFVVVCVLGQGFTERRRWLELPLICGVLSAFILYCAARLALIVEMFRGLAFLPPEAFAATWTGNIPHIG